MKNSSIQLKKLQKFFFIFNNLKVPEKSLQHPFVFYLSTLETKKNLVHKIAKNCCERDRSKIYLICIVFWRPSDGEIHDELIIVSLFFSPHPPLPSTLTEIFPSLALYFLLWISSIHLSISIYIYRSVSDRRKKSFLITIKHKQKLKWVLYSKQKELFV